MSLVTWTVKGDPWWDDSYSAMRFVLENEGTSYPCAISQIVLNDRFNTEDSKAAAIKNFNDHPDEVRLLAVRLIQDGQHDEHGTFFITSKVSHRYL